MDIGFTDIAVMSEREALAMNPLQLAYLGDAVWTYLVRLDLMQTGFNARVMHKMASSAVNAAAQASMLALADDALTFDERDVARRGRNAHTGQRTPKNQNAADYAAATGLEALIGYLTLTGALGRVLTLYRLCRDRYSEAGERHPADKQTDRKPNVKARFKRWKRKSAVVPPSSE